MSLPGMGPQPRAPQWEQQQQRQPQRKVVTKHPAPCLELPQLRLAAQLRLLPAAGTQMTGLTPTRTVTT